MSHAGKTHYFAALFLVVGACDPGETAVDSADVGSDVGTEDAGPLPQPPRLTVASPERGAWVEPTASVLVSGSVAATTSAVDRVKVAGEPITLTSGAFETSVFETVVTSQPGINFVEIRAESADGERAVDGRAWFRGDVHPVAASLPAAVRIHLSPEFLDDNDPEQDDLAGVAEALLVDPAVLSLVTGQQIETDFAVLSPTSASASKASVDVTPNAGELELALTLEDLEVTLDIEGDGLFADLLSGPARVRIEKANAVLWLALSVEDGKAQAETTWVMVTLDGFEIQSDALDTFIEESPTLGDSFQTLLAEFAQKFVTDELESLLSGTVGGIIAGLLDGFAYDTTFGEAVVIDVGLALQSARVAEHGINLDLSASIRTDIGSGVPFGPLGGSLKTPSTAPTDNFSSAPIAFVVDDDLLNQGAFAFWFAGPLSQRSLTPADFPELDLSAVPEVFAPLTRIDLDLRLPPTISPRTLTEDDFPYEANLGELLLDIHRGDGEVFKCSLSAATGFGLEFTETGSLRPRLDTRPKFVPLAIGCYDVPVGYDGGNVAAVLRLALPPLLNRVGPGFEFELGGLNFDAFTAAPAFADKAIRFEDLTARITGAENNQLLIEAAPLIGEKPPEPVDGTE